MGSGSHLSQRPERADGEENRRRGQRYTSACLDRGVERAPRPRISAGACAQAGVHVAAVMLECRRSSAFRPASSSGIVKQTVFSILSIGLHLRCVRRWPGCDDSETRGVEPLRIRAFLPSASTSLKPMGCVVPAVVVVAVVVAVVVVGVVVAVAVVVVGVVVVVVVLVLVLVVVVLAFPHGHWV